MSSFNWIQGALEGRKLDTYTAAREILMKYVHEQKVLIHSEGVSDYAYQLANKIAEKHPQLDINPEKVRIAALLHDIGKDPNKPYDEHEGRTIEILEEEGLYDIAKIAQHGFSNIERLLTHQDYNDRVQIENKIVNYADVRFKYCPMTSKERIQEAKTGWKGTHREIQAKEEYAKRIILRLEEELSELAGIHL